MDFTAQFLHTAQAMAELFIMTLVGYIIVKKRLIDANINDMLCRFLIDVALPLFIFAKIIQDFRFQAFPHWWLFPFLSIVITIIGFATGKLLTIGSAARARKAEFVSIITFQNSGYLPLGLVALLFPPSEASVLFVYIFLFLIGFNAVIFSCGVNMLSGKKETHWAKNIVTLPCIATIAALLIVLVRFDRFIPLVVIRPFEAIGNCTIPLGMITLGGILAESNLKENFSKRVELLLIAGKLVIVPLIVFCAARWLRVPRTMAAFLIIQAAVPPATTLSILAKKYGADAHFVSRSIFIGHLAGIVTIPLWLCAFAYFWR